jgi:hypothetical protein
LVSGVGHDVGCCVRVGLAAVGEHDVLPDADPARDGLTDLAGSDDNDDAHSVTSLFLRLVLSSTFVGAIGIAALPADHLLQVLGIARTLDLDL